MRTTSLEHEPQRPGSTPADSPVTDPPTPKNRSAFVVFLVVALLGTLAWAMIATFGPW